MVRQLWTPGPRSDGFHSPAFGAKRWLASLAQVLDGRPEPGDRLGLVEAGLRRWPTPFAEDEEHRRELYQFHDLPPLSVALPLGSETLGDEDRGARVAR